MSLGNLWSRFYAALLTYTVGTFYSLKQLGWKANKKIRRPDFLDDKLDSLLAVVTGGTKGIGLELAKLLVDNDFSLLLVARDKKDGQKAVETLKERRPTCSVQFYSVDLSDLNETRQFVSAVKKQYNKLHLLVNNAALMMTPYKLVQNGKVELQWATNVIATVFLSESLLPLVEKAAIDDGLGRIINLASSSMFSHNLTVKYINSIPTEEEYSAHTAYSNTKLAVALYTSDFQQMLNERKQVPAAVSTYCLHPGVIATDLYQHLSPFFRGFFAFPPTKMFLRSPKDSAWDLLYLCLADERQLVPGKYYENNVVASVPNLDQSVRQAFRDYVQKLKKSF